MFRYYFMIAIVLVAEASAATKCKVRDTTATCADRKGKVYEIYYEQNNNCRTTLTLCYVATKYRTFWTYSRVEKTSTPLNCAAMTRPPFRKGTIFDSRAEVQEYYRMDKQLEIMRTIIGNKANEFVNIIPSATDKLRFLARGHLAADADCDAEDDKKATYHYANVLPMWQQVNNGNWKAIESYIQEYSKSKPLDVWTGSIGILELPDENGIEKEIRLDVDKLPVPKLLYKIVYEPVGKAGVVFVTVNNPYLQLWKKADYIICADISHLIVGTVRKNLADNTNLDKGYSYACEVTNFISFNFNAKFPDVDSPRPATLNIPAVPATVSNILS